MLEAVIFDMDGVIVDTEPYYLCSYNKVLEPYHVAIDEGYNAKLVGRTSYSIWKTIGDDFHLNGTPEELEKKAEDFRKAIIEDEGYHPIEGTPQLIQMLHEKEILLAVASSSKRQIIEQVLHTLDLAQYFQVIVSGHECKQSKPDPEIFQKASKQLGVLPENCVVVEDSIHGIHAAKKAGMKTVGYYNEAMKGPSLEEADTVVRFTGDITIELLQSLFYE